MRVATPAFGIIIPVRNEAEILRSTLPAFLGAIDGLCARPIWVCNGCTDDSAQIIRDHVGRDAEIITLTEPGKAAALQSGDDALGDLFPRFYLDADVVLSPDALPILLHTLEHGKADLVAAQRIHDAHGVSVLSAMMARTWDALPYAREAGFQGLVGLSAAGRAAWGRWPEVLGDDIFMAASVSPHRRMIVPQATAFTRPPADFIGWVRMRARWRQGEAELRALSLTAPTASGQRCALLRQMVTFGQASGAFAFALARLLAPLVRRRAAHGWQPDRRGKS